MSQNKEQLVPINRVYNTELRFYTQFPDFVPVDRIGVNVARIHRLTHLAGIKTLTVTGANNQETSSITPIISGINSEGAASASFVDTRTKVQTHQTDSVVDNKNLPYDNQWLSTVVSINNTEITQRIRYDEHFKGNIRSAQAWSSYLDKAIKEGINSAGTNFLMKGVKKIDWGEFAAAYGLVIPTGTLFFRLMNLHIVYTGLFYIQMRFPNFLHELFSLRANPHQHKERFSIFFGPQADRALFLNLYSKMSGPVIKPLP